MNRVEEAVASFKTGVCCSQAVLCTYGKKGLFTTICPKMVQEAAEILEDRLHDRL